MTTITAQRQIRAAPLQAWDVISDVSRWADLLPTVDKVTPQTPKNLGPGGQVGARYAVKQPGLPTLVYEVTAWEPGQGFTWIAAVPGVRTLGTHHITATPGGCTLQLGLSWEGSLAGLIRVLYGRRTQRFVHQEADTFARLAEHQQSW